MQNSAEHKILPNEKFGVKATSECKTPSNETTIKDDSHRKIQVLNFGGYYASYFSAFPSSLIPSSRLPPRACNSASPLSPRVPKTHPVSPMKTNSPPIVYIKAQEASAEESV